MMEQTKQKIVSFDSYRFLMCLVIILHHIGINIYRCHGLPNPYFGFAHLACEVFFILSGFLIAKSYFSINWKEQSLDNVVHNFFIKRTKRLWPEYFSALLLCMILTTLFSHSLPLNMTFVNVLMLAGWGGVPNIINGVWYVVVLYWEGYILFNIMCYSQKRALNFYIPLISILCLFYLQNHGGHIDGHQWPVEFHLLSKGTIRGILGITVGIYCFEVCHFLENLQINWNKKNVDFILLIAEVFCTVMLIRLLLCSKGHSYNVYFYSAFLTGLLYFKKEYLLKFLSWNCWKKVSYLSYTIYLTHLIILEILRDHWLSLSHMNPIISYSIIVGICLVFGFVSFKFYEFLFYCLKKLLISENSSSLTQKQYKIIISSMLFILCAVCGISFYVKINAILYQSKTLDWIQGKSFAVKLNNDSLTKEIQIKKSKYIKWVKFRTITWHNQYERGELIVSLLNGNKEVIEKRKVALSNFRDQEIAEIKFTKQKLKKGTYFIKFECIEANKDFAISAIDKTQKSKFLINDIEQENQDIQILVSK